MNMFTGLFSELSVAQEGLATNGGLCKKVAPPAAYALGYYDGVRDSY